MPRHYATHAALVIDEGLRRAAAVIVDVASAATPAVKCARRFIRLCVGDITPADVYQLHREPAGWRWAKDGPRIVLARTKPAEIKKVVALKLAISATITDDRITSVLGPDVSIWSLTAQNPNNDIIRYPEDLAEYRKQLRSLFDEIKAAHGQTAVINVFPAIPVCCAVETGHVRMPKADLPLVIYDQASGSGFVSRLTIGGR